MKFTQITTYWTPDEAITVIDLLDQLREVLYRNYEDDIMRQYSHDHNLEEQIGLDFDGPTPF